MSAQDNLLGTYSPEDITVLINAGGVAYEVSGFIDGTFITISREVPAATLVTGADKASARVIRSNKSATINLSLLRTVQSNDILTQILNNDQRTRDDTWIFSILIKDNSGRSFYYGDQAFIGNNPDVNFSTSVEGNDWVIQVLDLDQYNGGNSKFAPSGAQALLALGGEIATRWQPA